MPMLLVMSIVMLLWELTLMRWKPGRRWLMRMLVRLWLSIPMLWSRACGGDGVSADEQAGDGRSSGTWIGGKIGWHR